MPTVAGQSLLHFWPHVLVRLLVADLQVGIALRVAGWAEVIAALVQPQLGPSSSTRPDHPRPFNSHVRVQSQRVGTVGAVPQVALNSSPFSANTFGSNTFDPATSGQPHSIQPHSILPQTTAQHNYYNGQTTQSRKRYTAAILSVRQGSTHRCFELERNSTHPGRGALRAHCRPGAAHGSGQARTQGGKHAFRLSGQRLKTGMGRGEADAAYDAQILGILGAQTAVESGLLAMVT